LLFYFLNQIDAFNHLPTNNMLSKIQMLQ